MTLLHDAQLIVEGLQTKGDSVRRRLVEDRKGGPDAGLTAEEYEAVRVGVEEMQLGLAAAQEKLAAASQAQVREEMAHAKEVASKDTGSHAPRFADACTADAVVCHRVGPTAQARRGAAERANRFGTAAR